MMDIKNHIKTALLLGSLTGLFLFIGALAGGKTGLLFGLIFAGGMKKGDWDVGLAIDAIKLAPKLDAVILISGDGDFVPLVEYLRINQGCQVEVASFGKSTSARLIEAADDFIDLDQNPKRYLLRSRGR